MLGICEFDSDGCVLVCCTGDQGHFRDSGDRSEGFSTESEGGDVHQVCSFRNLGSGMTLEAQDGLVRGHSLTVVNDLDEGPSCVGDVHDDFFSPGIHSILHQFLHNGSRTLHDLSRCDHIRDIAR